MNKQKLNSACFLFRAIAITNGTNSPITYDYDENGNIKAITQDGNTITYGYNELNELIREDNPIFNRIILYSYDAGGNMKTRKQYAYVNTRPSKETLASQTPLEAYDYTYDSVWKDKLLSYTVTIGGNVTAYSVASDEIGNPKAFTTNGSTNWTAAWEAGRQLQGLSASGQNLTFKYNDAGIRTEKNYNGVVTKYHFVGDKVTYEDNGTNKIYYTYDSTDNLVSMNITSTTDPSINGEYYYIRNAQSDIIGLIDKTGKQVVSYTYDSWSKLVSIDGDMKDTVGVKNPYGYRGYRYDSETGLYYLNSRYYNPEWGRFINADAITGATGELLSHNMFAYARNNPINMQDESGYWPSWLKKVAIGVAAVAVATVATVATGGTAAPIVLGLLKVAAISAVSGAAIDGTIGYFNGGIKGAINGAIDGAADGFMWGAITGGVAKVVNCITEARELHHLYPKYLGGAKDQPLKSIRTSVHRELHSDLRKFEGGWLGPKRGYTGYDIRNKFTSDEIESGLMRFYSQRRWRFLLDDYSQIIN